MNQANLIDQYNLMLDKYNLMVSALYFNTWDLFQINIKRGSSVSTIRTKKDVDEFLELNKNLIKIRVNISQPFSNATFEYAKKLQGIYGKFELTNELLAVIQIIIDLMDYRSSWDKTFNYPNKNSPLLRICPRLTEYLDERYNIFNLSNIDLLGDFEFGFNDFTFNIHPFVPYEFNRKIHGIMDGASEDIKKDIWLAFQTGTYIPRSLYLSLFLADYYRGSKFSKSILENKDSVIEHWRHDEDENSIKNQYLSLFFKKGLKRTEFMWSSKGKTKDFVIEEIIVPEETEKIDGENYICVKYIHTQFSLASGNCIHFDGCMNIYDSESYQIRSETNINKRSGLKAKKHMKLFRIDGESVITNDEWILLAGAFFKDNELVQEYFGNELPWQE